MPAKSKKQQKAAQMALACKRGHLKKSELHPSTRKMCASMTEKELRHYASGPVKKKGRRT